MRKTSLIAAGLIAAAAFVTPAMAQSVIQDPGTVAQNYLDSDYLTGGYGPRGTPGPGFYYRHGYAPGAATEIPFGGPYYGGPYGAGVAVAPSDVIVVPSGYSYYGRRGYY